MKTKRGIYHDIRESDYTVTIGTTIFYFTSELYRDKFEMLYQEETERFNQALNNVYKNNFDIVGDILAWIRLYCLIEKRGFYLQVNGVDVHCLEDLRFVVMPNYKVNSDE